MVPNATEARSVRQGKQPRVPISRKRIESVLSRSVAGFCVVFAAQTVPVMLGQLGPAHPLWVSVTVAAVLASLIVAVLASIARRAVRAAHGMVSIVLLAALVTWPFAVIDTSAVPNTNHWLYYLLTVGTATAAIAFSTRTATIYLFVVPTIYGLVRATEQGGGATAQQAALDSIYAIILGGAVIVIVTMLRQAAAAVDTAQSAALERYGNAVRQHATEVERVQVDSIVHDNVLTTFLSAARAETPEAKALSATMADHAIRHLQEAALIQPDTGTNVRLSDLAARLAATAGDMSSPFEIRKRALGEREIPATAAEALYSAAVQAIVNSLQHGGHDDTVLRWISIRGVGRDGIQIEVGDTREGFLVDQVPRERLGLRVSIIERVASAGGSAEISSDPGLGTVVTLAWPSDEANPAPVFEEIAAGTVAVSDEAEL